MNLTSMSSSKVLTSYLLKWMSFCGIWHRHPIHATPIYYKCRSFELMRHWFNLICEIRWKWLMTYRLQRITLSLTRQCSLFSIEMSFFLLKHFVSVLGTGHISSGALALRAGGIFGGDRIGTIGGYLGMWPANSTPNPAFPAAAGVTAYITPAAAGPLTTTTTTSFPTRPTSWSQPTNTFSPDCYRSPPGGAATGMAAISKVAT